MLAWALLGCGRGEVVYDVAGDDDAVDDLVYATVVFGSTEADQAQLGALHVAGGTLRMDVHRTHRLGGLRWTAETLDPDIAEVTAADTTSDGLRVELAFHRAGATEFFVYDQNGTVVDVQPIEVRDPTVADLLDWVDLAAGRDAPLPDEVHVAAGTSPRLAVRWRDEAGESLVGGGILTVQGTPISRVTASADFEGAVDVLALDLDADAQAGSFSLDLSSPGESFPRDFRVHPRSEVDRVELDPIDGADGGLLRAAVFAGDDPLAGADVDFSWKHGEAHGTGLTWKPGPTTTVEACFDQVCDSLILSGRPTGTAEDAGSGGCGCDTDRASLGGLLPLLAAITGRRRRGPAST